ncbi:MAG: ShlB/FhaC/HecB family hemolysin secretion/activation protein [Cyanobacteria bacterium P01_A01_bin.83]
MYLKIISIVLGIVISNLAIVGEALGQIKTVKSNIIKIEEIEIEGNTLFSDSELNKIVAPVEGRTVTFEQLLEIKNAVVKFYRDQGYISSGAFLPAQKLQNGRLTIRVIEGSLDLIEIEGLSRLNEQYIIARLPEPNQPVKISDLTKALKKLQDDPLIKEVEGELKVLEQGKNLLALKVQEHKPIQTQLKLTNTFSPTVGSFGGEVIAKHQNLLGFGDRLGASYTRTEGLERYGVSYSVPFNTDGGTIGIDYQNADSELIEEVISAFDIQADYEVLSLALRQPVIDNENEELTVSVELEALRSETFVLDDVSFAFVDGLEDGESKIRPLRLGKEYVRRSERNLIAAESRFNVGLDILDATNTTTGIDSIFWSWQGNFQWIKALNSKQDWLLKTSLSTQLSPDQLLPIEQLTVGGLGSVRGYRQNLIIGDNGLVGVVEGQLPFVKSSTWGSVSLAPFFDVATIWSNIDDPEDDRSNTLASLGLSFNYRLKKILDAQIFYGVPLIEADGFGDSDTEERWGFTLLVSPLNL